MVFPGITARKGCATVRTCPVGVQYLPQEGILEVNKLILIELKIAHFVFINRLNTL